MKTIGILGGISPQATMDLEARIHQVAQQLIPQHGNCGYPGLLVYYHRRPPVLTTDGLIRPVLPIQPDPDLLEAARWLGQKADFLLIGSNGVHMFQAPLEQASGRKVLSMIDLTLQEVQRRGWKKVGVLGFPMANVPVYTTPLASMGLGTETIGDDLQNRLNAAITAFVEGKHSDHSAEEAITELHGRGVDGIILGCTEIPLLLGETANQPNLINPLELLAEAAVGFARSEEIVLEELVRR